VRKSVLMSFAAAGVLAAVGVVNAATLDGDTVTVEMSTGFGGSQGAQTVVVGAGYEGNYYSNQYFDLNDGANGDLFTITSTGDFCGMTSCSGSGDTVTWTLTGLDFGTPITGFSLSSSIGGATASFTGTSVTISWTEAAIPFGTYTVGQFLTGPSAVPLPAGLPMVASGIGALVMLRKRRKAA
jgi:hypothetical protein